MTKGLFLDFDGTLADSLAVMRHAYERFLATNRCAGSEDEFRSLNGPPLDKVVGQLRHNHRLKLPLDELIRQYRCILAALHHRIKPSAGARQLLSTAQERAYRVAVVTSADTATVSAWLTHHELRPFVTRIVGGDCVSRGKPDPEPYLRALALLDCDVKYSMAIEDSPIGATAAVAAGLRTYVLRTLVSKTQTWPKIAGFIDHLTAANDLLND